MLRRVGLCSTLILLLALALAARASAAASGALCSADPFAGPPGTRFHLVCSGFSPNTYLNAYLVEPDGRAVSGGQVVGFTSNVGNGNILTDKDGNAEFWWQSQNGSIEQPGGGAFAHQLGQWTWVVHELGPNRAVTIQGEVSIRIQAYAWEQSGATLTATSTNLMNYGFSGAGFVRDEYVNIWVTLPPNCSGRANVEGASADDPFFQGLFDGFFGPSTVKANERGEISFSIVFTARACRGLYSVTTYAPGSGYGAITQIEVGGQAVPNSPGAAIAAMPSSLDALNPVLTILGSGWSAGDAVNCWSTRPDGRSFAVGNVTADAGGTFALDALISGGDSFAPLASEEPGVWSLTCRAPGTGKTALTQVTVHALTVDP